MTNPKNLLAIFYTTWKGNPCSEMWFFVQLCSSWQDFNWLKASRGPSAIAELLVVLTFSTAADMYRYLRFPYLRIPSLHIRTWVFHTYVFHPCNFVLRFSMLPYSVPSTYVFRTCIFSRPVRWRSAAGLWHGSFGSAENARPENAIHEMQTRTLSVLLKMQDLKLML